MVKERSSFILLKQIREEILGEEWGFGASYIIKIKHSLEKKIVFFFFYEGIKDQTYKVDKRICLSISKQIIFHSL